MHSDEGVRAERTDSKREMLRLKTPSVSKLFNYLRYCWGRGGGGTEIWCKPVRRRNKGDDFNEEARE